LDLRDPVHNFIHLSDEERKLLDTPPLQRLRGIRQLAMANLVYPGALHTRFDHTLGVMHVAGLMARQLRLDGERNSKDDIRLLRLAALLHDVGHGPFSHVSEAALDQYAGEAAIPVATKKEKIHEMVTAQIILENAQIRKIIGEETSKNIVQLLRDGYGEPVLKSIISGPLDADKQDYLLRDSQFCGVRYGVFDIHQLHRSLVLVGQDDDRQLMVKEDGVHALEQYAMAKYYMTTNVYRHRVRLITDQMIVRAITLGVETDQIAELRKLFTYRANGDFVDNYLQWDDARFMVKFCLEQQQTACGRMLEALRSRRLHKCIFRAKIAEFSDDARENVKGLSELKARDMRKLVESELAKVVRGREKFSAGRGGFCDDSFIVHSYTIKSVRESSRDDEAGMMVAGLGNPKPFEEESILFRSINEKMDEAFCELYVPVEWESATERKRERESLRGEILICINELCKRK